MRVVNVAHFESCSVAVEAAGTERGELALVRELGGGVGLVHELRQLRGAEEFADDGRYGADVDESRGRDFHCVLGSHALLYELFEAGNAYAQLVGEQFADRAHAAVAEMVDIIYRAYAVLQIYVGGYRSDDVVDGDVLVVELFDDGLYCLLFVLVERSLVAREQHIEHLAGFDELYALVAAALPVLLLFGLFVVGGGYLLAVIDGVDAVDVLFGDLFARLRSALGGELLHEQEVGKIYRGQQPEHLGILIGDRLEVYRVVGDYLVLYAALYGVVYPYVHFVYARILNFECAGVAFDDVAGVGDYFARAGVGYVLCERAAGQTVCQVELFVELVPADFDHVVPAGVKEEIVEVLLYRSFGGHFARAQTAVEFDKTVAFGLGGVLGDGVFHHLVIGKEV